MPEQRNLALTVIAGATVLGVLVVAKEVLVPITLALMLSLAIAPLVRRLRRLGLGQTGAVVAASALVGLVCSGIVVVVGIQLVRLAADLPQYGSTIESKLKSVSELTVGRIETMATEARRFTDRMTLIPRAPGTARAEAANATTAPNAVLVEIQPPRPNAYQLASQALAVGWAPLQTTGVVLVVLLFVLLDHEALRDRFIRLAGGADLRATTAAINDATERLSRFFVSQFALNFGTGAAVWLGLSVIGFPHAALWGVLTAALRFVPYVGAAIAALSAATLAAAVDPGWSLMVLTLVIFVVIELTASQFIEPHLYGHTTGLSALSVVVAAIFWSWLWGPIGLIVSTPLTLCLVVAGRHVRTLNFLDVLLGDTQALTLPQRFYQRVLSGDSREIIASARAFLKQRTFPAYCDHVLMPALFLASADFLEGSINAAQSQRVSAAIVEVIHALDAKTRAQRRRAAQGSVLDDLNAGLELRRRREQVSGRWQGPLVVPPHSVAVCVGGGAPVDDLATELLVRILRDLGIDARHLSAQEFAGPVPPGADPGNVALICHVKVLLGPGDVQQEFSAAEARLRLPDAKVLAFVVRRDVGVVDATPAEHDADFYAESFEEAAQQAINHFARPSAMA